MQDQIRPCRATFSLKIHKCAGTTIRYCRVEGKNTAMVTVSTHEEETLMTHILAQGTTHQLKNINNFLFNPRQHNPSVLVLGPW